jgi:hypothetical protein
MRGFARHTLSEGACDVWLGVASGVDRVATTRPYYRSTYVFVTRADQRLKGLTLDDPRLKSLKIGVQLEALIQLVDCLLVETALLLERVSDGVSAAVCLMAASWRCSPRSKANPG